MPTPARRRCRHPAETPPWWKDVGSACAVRDAVRDRVRTPGRTPRDSALRSRPAHALHNRSRPTLRAGKRPNPDARMRPDGGQLKGGRAANGTPPLLDRIRQLIFLPRSVALTRGSAGSRKPQSAKIVLG